MFGLALGKVQVNSPTSQSIIMNSVRDIAFTTGITKLAYVVIFNLISSYNPDYQIGSAFGELVKNLVLLVGQPVESTLKITDELEGVKNRIRFAQSKNTNIPSDERLKKINILNITIDDANQSVIVDMEIINELDEIAYVQI